MSSNQHTLGVYTAITSRNCTQVPREDTHTNFTETTTTVHVDLIPNTQFSAHHLSANIILNGFSSMMIHYTSQRGSKFHSTQLTAAHLLSYVYVCSMRKYLHIHKNAFVWWVYQRLRVTQATSLLLCYHSKPINQAVSIPSTLVLQVTQVFAYLDHHRSFDSLHTSPLIMERQMPMPMPVVLGSGQEYNLSHQVYTDTDYLSAPLVQQLLVQQEVRSNYKMYSRFQGCLSHCKK